MGTSGQQKFAHEFTPQSNLKGDCVLQILFTADLKSFSDFEDPLLSVEAVEVTSGTQLLVKKEAQEPSFTIKNEVKIEETEVQISEIVTPVKRKRTSPSASTSGASKARQSRAPKTMKQEISTSAIASLYPTPPETPSSGKAVDFDYFGDSPISLVERVKRSRTSIRRA